MSDESTEERFDNRPEVPQTEGAKLSDGRSAHKVNLDPTKKDEASE